MSLQNLSPKRCSVCGLTHPNNCTKEKCSYRGDVDTTGVHSDMGWINMAAGKAPEHNMRAHTPPFDDVDEGTKSDGWSTDYYEIPEGSTELHHLIEHKNMNFAVGNIFKACYRMGEKAGYDALYDLNKIIWYAEREKARIEGEK